MSSTPPLANTGEATGTTPAASADGTGKDVGLLAQDAAEAHLKAIWEAEEAADETGDYSSMESPAVGPWDGCETCVVREVLYAAWPFFESDAIARLRAAGFDGAADLLAADALKPTR